MLRKMLFGAAALALTLGLVSTANAAEHGHEGHGRGGEVRHYEHGQGHQFRGGVYFHGSDHPRWERREWDVRYHRYHYCDLGVWYYWNAGAGCYYPDTYCP